MNSKIWSLQMRLRNPRIIVFCKKDEMSKLNDTLLGGKGLFDENSLTSDQKKQLELLHVEYIEIIDKNNTNSKILLSFVSRSLSRFHLQDSYTESEIISIAYNRALNSIYEGKKIFNHFPWFRQTTYNIIREISRDNKKIFQFDENLHDNFGEAVVEVFNVDLELINLAFESLSEEDKNILTLKIVEEKPWQEISNIFREKGDFCSAEDVLRKRKQRALSRLRKKFHELKMKSY
jgi:DNA-directed RNA polymerase specialized sigma24 family protein